ncbi:MAG: primosomal protein N' [Candidatus Borkfalkiaceae bacterium]|nr:primosomal protein N' [Christensenellaceae bacterium]
MIAEVIVDIAHSATDRVFDYKTGDLCVSAGCRVVVPFAGRKIEGIVISVKEKSDLPEQKLKSILEIADDVPALTEESLSLAYYISKRYFVTKAAALRLFLPSEMRKGRISEKTVEFLSAGGETYTEESLPKAAKSQRACFAFVKQKGRARAAALRNDYGASAVKALLEKGYLISDRVRVSRLPYSEMLSKNKEATLTPAQQKAVDAVFSSDKTVTLIHGVTGSGKTEVYLNLISRAIESGKTAIMLVPEISLTPQMLTQLRGRFNELCAILHSGLSAGERFDEWWRLRSGEAKIAIGARSAIFAPLENLGVIIIDEEHDGSYESESAPRYSTMDIALKRAAYNGCKIAIGSATPSVESYKKALEGVYELVKMPERINKKPLPEVIVADMRQEVRRGNNGCFSGALKQELAAVLQKGDQAIIFLNRRGYSQQVICRECGYVAKCAECDVTLNYHKAGDMLKCHYCGTNYKMPKVCPQCGSPHFNLLGTGTQKIVSELKELFPSAKILRMDNDTTQTKEGHYKILSAFASHEADILVGTQMIAKGHDFPHVTLVGILDADMSLYFSDFRASERTYQLITQVAGRSGRAGDKGTVVLQTFSPENPVLKLAVNYDYIGFYEREITIRKATDFPPFALIIRILVESENEEIAVSTLKDVYIAEKQVYDENRQSYVFFNKMRSPIKRLKNKFRYQVLMRIRPSDELRAKIYEAALSAKNDKAFISVEENPANLS